jgi:hypothetical protein
MWFPNLGSVSYFKTQQQNSFLDKGGCNGGKHQEMPVLLEAIRY